MFITSCIVAISYSFLTLHALIFVDDQQVIVKPGTIIEPITFKAPKAAGATAGGKQKGQPKQKGGNKGGAPSAAGKGGKPNKGKGRLPNAKRQKA
jgi:hypothetical protein